MARPNIIMPHYILTLQWKKPEITAVLRITIHVSGASFLPRFRVQINFNIVERHLVLVIFSC